MTSLKRLAAVSVIGLFVQAQTTTNNRITLACDLAPNAIQVGQTAGVSLTCVNANAASTASIQPGDIFVFQFDLGDGRIARLGTQVFVNSASLASLDFALGFGSDSSAVTVTYSGPAKPFPPGDSFSLEATVVSPTTVRGGKVVYQAPAGAAYNSPSPAFSTLSSTTFPFGTPGPTGAQGPQGPLAPLVPQGPQGDPGPA